MARKHELRKLREGTVINATARQQESDLYRALARVGEYVARKFDGQLDLAHEKTWRLRSIVAELQGSYPDVDFHCHSERTNIRPDGGFLVIKPHNEDDLLCPILISEVKNQGMNDLRAQEGLPPQPPGNAVERLGKSVIALRTALMRESIFPFVCFGYGCDFEEGSSILDRVTQIAMFGHLNKTYLHNQGDGRFNRGSFYFREEAWTVDEMADIMNDIAERSVHYYFSKYSEQHFVA